MKAVKNNRVYTIDETQSKNYSAQGFDIIGDDGEVLEHAVGKTVPYEKYSALVAENMQLKARIVELEALQYEPAEKTSGRGKKD